MAGDQGQDHHADGEDGSGCMEMGSRIMPATESSGEETDLEDRQPGPPYSHQLKNIIPVVI